MDGDGENLIRGDKPPEKIRIGHLTHQVYTPKDDARHTADRGKYYIPSAPNNATFDAFFRCQAGKTGIGLQMTIRTEHSLSDSGLKALGEQLKTAKKRYFVFVIPKGQRFKFKRPSPQWESMFNFYTLELADSKYFWSPLTCED
jgi:hypothetical protein